jgi:galactokinase
VPAIAKANEQAYQTHMSPDALKEYHDSHNLPTRDRVVRAFTQRFEQRPQFIARAPGRVNLLGEHVDYNDGFVLPAAIEQATWLAFSHNRANEIELYALDFDEDAAFTPDSTDDKTDPHGEPLPAWAHYPAGVAWALGEASLAVVPLQGVYASDVPRGAGLSSSASVEVAFGVAWRALSGWDLPAMHLARLCQRAENEYVGVRCGLMDQFASACGREGHALHLDCRSLEWRALPLPGEAALVILDTSVRRALSGSAYNQRRAACEQAVKLLERELPGIRALRDVDPRDFKRLAGSLPPEVEKRARHVVEEIARTRQAVPLLEAGDIAGFGALMNDCHRSLRDLYEVSSPELDTMAATAEAQTGCYGARLTGAGFGGCALAMVEQGEVAKFKRAVQDAYTAQTGLTPAIYVTSPAAGAGVEEIGWST